MPEIDLSIIVPVYNENEYLDQLVKSLLTKDGLLKELLIVDGGSTDGSVKRILCLAHEEQSIKYIANPKRFVSEGFNKAFQEAEGKYIALVGSHASYSEGYFSHGVKILDDDKADAVGGILLQRGKTEKSEVIAKVMSSKLGVGNTPFRTENNEKYVKSTAFAIYKREIFEKVGLLDEALIRNQDDEFHYRLNAAGFRMLMTPEMQSIYYVRDNLRSLFQQYFQYGLYKPLVIKKVPSGFQLRHLIPFLFVCYLILLLPASLSYPQFLVPLGLYFILILIESINLQDSIQEMIYSMLVFATLHIAYGLGFLLGIPKVIYY